MMLTITGSMSTQDSMKINPNRISISAHEFIASVSAPVAQSYRLKEALDEMRASCVEKLDAWDVPRIQAFSESMVGPMRRVHRWRRHQQIETLRRQMAPFSTDGEPWWKLWEWRYRNLSRRRKLKANMLLIMRQEARIDTHKLAQEYVEAIQNHRDSTGKLSYDSFRHHYEGGYFSSEVPTKVALNNLNVYAQVNRGFQLKNSVNEMTCSSELVFLHQLKETLDAAQVWPADAMLDLSVDFMSSTRSLNTLVNAKLIETMKQLNNLSIAYMEEPLPIPEVVQGSFAISGT